MTHKEQLKTQSAFETWCLSRVEEREDNKRRRKLVKKKIDKELKLKKNRKKKSGDIIFIYTV